MSKKRLRRQAVSRRTLLSGTAGLFGGATLLSGFARARNAAPASTVAAQSSYDPHYPDPAWLALRQEEILEPALEIIDPHHHLWDHPGNRFLLDQLLADTGSGHKIIQTVFVECGSMYRADGPTELKPVGGTEFVNGTAAMSASGQYGQRVSAMPSSAMPICVSATGSRKCCRPRLPPGTAAFEAFAIPWPGTTAMRSPRRAPIPLKGKCSIPPGARALGAWRR